MTELVLIAALAACFASTALLAVAEVSIVRVRRPEALARADGGDRRAGELLDLLDDLPVTLNSVLFVVLLLQVSAATIGAVLAERWFGGLGITLTSFGLTLALFVYAEAIPKTLAVRRPYQMAIRVTPVLKAVSTVIKPIVGVLVALADLQSPGRGATLGVFTEAELLAAARDAADAGEIDLVDAELVERSFRFNDRAVSEVMVPRSGISAVNASEPVSSALATAISGGYRRLPVMGDGIDDILGAVRLRDLAGAVGADPDVEVRPLATPLLRCSPDSQIADLMAEMQRTGQHIAIVTHQSQTVGLATIEDLVSELVGEIADSDDQG